MAQAFYTAELCTFCYKCVQDDQNEKSQIIELFCLLLKRFTGDNRKTSQQSLLSSRHVCCRDCENLVMEFCDVYHKIKCFELQLFSKLKTLEEVMKMADKVPSRVKLLKHYFDDCVLLKEKSNNANENANIDVNSQNKDKLTIFRSTRSEILRNCQKGQALSMLSPRVTLKRHNEDTVLIKSPVTSVDISPPISQSGTEDFEAQFMSNVSSDNDGNEQISDKSYFTCDTQHELFTSIDLSTNSESVYEEDSTQVVKNGSGNSLEKNIQSTTDQTEIVSATNFSQNTNEKSSFKVLHSFPCLHCSKTFIQEKYLKSHMWSRHRTAKRRNVRKHLEIPANHAKFRCGLCNIFCKTYQGLQSHKYSAIHQVLFRRNLKTRLAKISQSSNQLKIQKTESQNIPQHITLEKEGRLSSDESDDSTASSCSSSSHDENEELDGKKSQDKYLYCRQDECKSNVKIFKRKIFLLEHKKLHKRDQYSCNFCDKIESTAIKLSLHECEMHSDVQSPLNNSKTDEETYNCARCPFDTKSESSYFKHFASVHLGIYNAKVGKDTWDCDICKKKLINRKHTIETHFKTHHDTQGLDDPQKQIRRCNEQECTAYFLSTEQLRIHKEMQHSSTQPSNHFLSEDSDDADDFEIQEKIRQGPQKCKFCEKIFPSHSFLQKHVRKFHSRKTSANVSNLKTEFPEKVQKYKRLVCPDIRCTKTFPTRIGLDNHKTHHGTFPCNFCEHVTDYAPDLALHENQIHSSKPIETPFGKKKLTLIKCSRCPKTFFFQGLYETHFLSVHLGLQTTFGVCQVCRYASNSESDLLNHINRYHNTNGMDPAKISKCDVCPAHFRTSRQLIHHKANIHHTNDNPLKCTKCDNVFRSESGLQIHLKTVHSIKNCQTMYNCVLDKCKRKFPTKQLLERHQKLHERNEFKCQFCEDVCDTAIKLITHETTKHLQKPKNEKLFSCSRCSYKHYFVGKFHSHFAEVHLNFSPPITDDDRQMPGNFECKVCKLKLSYGSDLAIHEAQHNQNTRKYIACSRCPRDLKNKKVYVAHFLRKHLGTSKRQKCSICNEDVIRLDTHYKNNHKIDELVDSQQIYKCEEQDYKCEAYFITPKQLIRHKRIFHNNDWKCKECGKILKSSLTLKSHIKLLHPFSLPFQCEISICKKRFGTTAELDYHKMWHSKSASSLNSDSLQQAYSKFKCEKCDKEFVFKTQLQSHMANAHSKRSFICPECGKVFKLKSGLDKHLLYHSGPSSWKFQCSTCGKKCVTKITLASHMNTHSKEKSWVCQFCGNKYAHQHNWKNHLLLKHGNEDGVPRKMKKTKGNELSRKGTKKGTCILAGE